jgi:hypothetical protein
MCRWTFDEGLLGISQVYEVIAFRQINSLDNLPGYLTNLEGVLAQAPELRRPRPVIPDSCSCLAFYPELAL